ncbi:efflux transporter periplasmic adaptor subunit, partial [Pseudomonas sp. HMWF031]
GIEHGSLVVRSAVPNPYNGMKVRLPGDEPVLSDAAESDASEDNDKVESTSTEGDSE